jgi:hypothetical protein
LSTLEYPGENFLEFPDFLEGSLVPERNLLERVTSEQVVAPVPWSEQ